VLDFITRMENVSIHSAAIKAIEWFGLNLEVLSSKSEERDECPGEVRHDNAVSPSKSAAKKTPPIADNSGRNKPLKFRLDKLQHEHPYLAERGLTLDTSVGFGVGYCGKGMMAERIAIPIRNPEGDVVAYAGRWPGMPADDAPKYKLPQGFRKSLELFNIDRASKESVDKPLVIVEGFFGCMKLHQHGCHKVVALMGSSMSIAQEDLIRKHTTHKSQVILMLDEDEAGRVGREEIAVRLAKFLFVKIHIFDQPEKQPEDLSADEVAALFS